MPRHDWLHRYSHWSQAACVWQPAWRNLHSCGRRSCAAAVAQSLLVHQCQPGAVQWRMCRATLQPRLAEPVAAALATRQPAAAQQEGCSLTCCSAGSACPASPCCAHKWAICRRISSTRSFSPALSASARAACHMAAAAGPCRSRHSSLTACRSRRSEGVLACGVFAVCAAASPAAVAPHAQPCEAGCRDATHVASLVRSSTQRIAAQTQLLRPHDHKQQAHALPMEQQGLTWARHCSHSWGLTLVAGPPDGPGCTASFMAWCTRSKAFRGCHSRTSICRGACRDVCCSCIACLLWLLDLTAGCQAGQHVQTGQHIQACVLRFNEPAGMGPVLLSAGSSVQTSWSAACSQSCAGRSSKVRTCTTQCMAYRGTCVSAGRRAMEEEPLDSDMVAAAYLTHLQQGLHRQRRSCRAALLHHLVVYPLQQVGISQG